MGTSADAPLVAELERGCHTLQEQLREGVLPQLDVPGLERTPHGLNPVSKPSPDWRSAVSAHARTDGFWDRLGQLADGCRDDPDVEAAVGYASDPGGRAVALWQSLIQPALIRYGVNRPGLEWDPALAQRLVSEWREIRKVEGVWHRTVAPLHNLRGPEETIQVEDDLVVRPLSDEDRESLWRGFGGAGNHSEISPTPEQLERWSHAIELRWRQPRRPPVSDDPALEAIQDAVRAIRLNHPGVTGTTILWTRLDPPDLSLHWPGTGDRLYAPHGRGLFLDPLRAELGPASTHDLQRLLHALRQTRADRRLELSLRRFDSAYERYEQADSLIDLWIAFEALLLPTERAELKFRAALRIAALVGSDGDSRQKAFTTARRSYNVRSALVHGDPPPDDLDDVLRSTRELAREVLRAWLLSPPVGGVEGLDRSLLA
jgi:hypothetical protein